MFEIEGKHILVTGGSSGFGRHFAHLPRQERRKGDAGGAPRRSVGRGVC